MSLLKSLFIRYIYDGIIFSVGQHHKISKVTFKFLHLPQSETTGRNKKKSTSSSALFRPLLPKRISWKSSKYTRRISETYIDWVKGRVGARVQDGLHDQSLDSYKIVNPPPCKPRLAPRICWFVSVLLTRDGKKLTSWGNTVFWCLTLDIED